MEVCSSCGKLTDRLVDFTGWCTECTPTNCCDSCGRTLSNGYLLNGHSVCSLCKLEGWYGDYGDEVEYQLTLGFSLTRSIAIVTKAARPSCLSCGGLIYHGTRGRTHFCTKHASCRKAARRLKYYRQEVGLSSESALQAVIKTLTQELTVT